MDNIWSNKYLKVSAVINNLGLVEKNTLVECRYSPDGKEEKLFKINNVNYPVLVMKNGKLEVDEYILANKILTELDDNCEIEPAFAAGESGKYLVEAANDKNYYFEDGFIYDLDRLKSFRISKLKQYIDEVDDSYLKEANETLLDIIDSLKISECKSLVKNNLHFELAHEPDKDFGRITPVYGGRDKRRVAGLIRHVKNSLMKYGKFEISDVESCIDILKRRTKDTYSWEDRKDGVLYKAIAQDGSASYDVLIDDGDTVTVFGDTGSESFSKDQIDKILQYLE